MSDLYLLTGIVGTVVLVYLIWGRQPQSQPKLPVQCPDCGTVVALVSQPGWYEISEHQVWDNTPCFQGTVEVI